MALFRLFTVTAVIGLTVGLYAAADTPIADSESSPERHFLWRVVGPTGAQVFLLGSIHALPEEAYPLPKEMERAFDEAETVAFEVDMEEITRAAGQMMSAAALPPGRSLASELDPRTRSELHEFLDGAGLSVDTFSAMRPWMVALTLTTLELMKAGYSPEAGIDFHFARRVVEEGKTSISFEDADFQIGLFTGMSPEQERAFLRYTLRDLRQVVPQLKTLTEAWRRGDVASLAGLLTAAFADDEELFGRLVTERNEAWLPQVKTLLAGDRTALVVVGALHLVGPTGLVERLREQGYEIEQL